MKTNFSRLSIVVFGSLCVALAFTVGLASSEARERYDADIQLLQCKNAIAEHAYKGTAIVYPMEYEQCLAMFDAYRVAYPTYWTGTENVVLNGQDDRFYFCDFMAEYYNQ